MGIYKIKLCEEALPGAGSVAVVACGGTVLGAPVPSSAPLLHPQTWARVRGPLTKFDGDVLGIVTGRGRGREGEAGANRREGVTPQW